MQKGLDYIGVGAGAVILNSKGDIFLAKRGKNARNERGRWEFPGGAVEFGETLHQALIREVREEYGIEILIHQLLDIVDHILPTEHQHWVSPTYLCSISRGEPAIQEPDKCDAIAWFALDEIPVHDLTLASRKSLHSLRRYLSQHI